MRIAFMPGRGTSAPREVATATIDGREYRAESHSSCECALARMLVAAGVPDQPWQTVHADGTVGLRGKSLHRQAGLTVTESDRGGLRLRKFTPFRVSGVAQDGAEDAGRVVCRPPAGRRAVIAHVRNAHPTKRMFIPLGGGWARLLYPGVTTAVPERALHTPLARQLLTAKLIELADGAAWDADVRQRRAARTDMARAIAAAEAREFARLVGGLRGRSPWHGRKAGKPRKPRANEWPAAQLALLRQRAEEGVSRVRIAAELGRTLSAVEGQAKRQGARLHRTPPPNKWSAEWTETLKQRWAAGVPGRQIAEELGTGAPSVWSHAARLGLEKRFDNRNGGRKASAVRNTLDIL